MNIKKSEKRDKYSDLARELKKTVEHGGDGNTNNNWCIWNDPQRFGKAGVGRVGKSEDVERPSRLQHC